MEWLFRKLGYVPIAEVESQAIEARKAKDDLLDEIDTLALELREARALLRK